LDSHDVLVDDVLFFFWFFYINQNIIQRMMTSGALTGEPGCGIVPLSLLSIALSPLPDAGAVED
jgi:hypothetical protein